ncbi:MAG: acyltransferase [Lachnospiraceae bacterium]|nr:acyltransferase [Lachnospiraceae bacterium]
MKKNSEREVLPDILRGFAIILVVLGHCIQEGSGEIYRMELSYFSDRLYQFIYSFHMPLFMLISGYLGWYSIKRCVNRKGRLAVLRSRALSLLIPIFFWTALDYARILFVNYVDGRPQPEALVFVYFYNALNNLWFLWAVWWSFLVVYVMHNFLNDNIIIYVFGFLLLFILPDGLGMGAYKYMLPYYLAGYYVHGYMQKKEKCIKKDSLFRMIGISGLAFAGLFIYYNEDSFIYLTGYKIIGKSWVRQFGIDLYRMAIGFAGSVFFIVIWQYFLRCADKMNQTGKVRIEFRILRKLGADSMGIYIISGYMMIFIIQRIDFIRQPSYICNIIETIIVLALSWLITMIIEKIPVLKKIIGKK